MSFENRSRANQQHSPGRTNTPQANITTPEACEVFIVFNALHHMRRKPNKPAHNCQAIVCTLMS